MLKVVFKNHAMPDQRYAVSDFKKSLLVSNNILSNQRVIVNFED
jgi:hypothetical protein